MSSRSGTELPTGGSRPWAEAVAGATARAKWGVLVLWLALLVLGGLGAGSLAERLSNGSGPPSSADSVRVDALLADGFQGRSETTMALVVRDERNTAESAAFDARVRGVVDEVLADPRLGGTSAYGWNTAAPERRDAFVGADDRTALVSVGLGLDDTAATTALPSMQREFDDRYGPEGLRVALVNIQAFQGELIEESAESLARAEILALPLIVVVLLLLFRSVTATVVALATTLTGIAFTLGILDVIAQHVLLNVFAQNIVVMLGLGVGVDYALVMLKRFKQELAEGATTHAAVARTVATAGHTVIASALTIIVAVAALFVTPMNAVISLAIGAALVVAMAMLVAVLLLPALLHVLGHRINAGRVWVPAALRRDESDPESTRWYKVTLWVMNRPVLCLVTVVTALALLAVPVFGMKLYTPDARSLSEESAVGAGAQIVAEQFGPGAASPIVVVLEPKDDGPFDAAALAELTRFVGEVKALPDVAAVNSALPFLQGLSPADPRAALDPAVLARVPADLAAGVRHFVAGDGEKFVVEVVATGRSSEDVSRRLLDDVRARAAESRVLTAVVGGETARGDDSNAEIARALPLVLILMLVAVYLVLLGTFRSVFLPLKAIATNVLTVGATFGVMVMIFQFGWAPDWLGLGSAGGLFFIDPLIVLALIVGLSTDYEVFLLSRVREEYLASGDNRAAVARGMARTAPMITGAAVLMIVVFGAFGFSGLMPIQHLGIGLAVAVAIDATVVRVVVVPAAMQLMGRWNWWNPLERNPVGRTLPSSSTGSSPRSPSSSVG
ncbi:MMPL family transporter [Nocardia takedensis]|uniref:MMPL family transporter n=1 Tax=Nocardia takedensis TaxID=259390 RepID=UPI00030BA8E1|nr:MMPL family transporter [Nocardia takedensis]